jgi:hypothetical protein
VEATAVGAKKFNHKAPSAVEPQLNEKENLHHEGHEEREGKKD